MLSVLVIKIKTRHTSIVEKDEFSIDRSVIVENS